MADAQPDADPPAPLPLDAVNATGATWFGTPVRVLWVELADGRKQKLEPPIDPAAVVDVVLTPLQRRIVDVLRASPKGMKRVSVAVRLGLTDARGKFGQQFARLVQVGRVCQLGEYYADDPAKLVPE